MTMHVKVSTAFKDILQAFENVSGVEKEIKEGYENVGGVWKKFFSRTEVDASTIVGQSNAAVSPDDSYAGIRFRPNGTWELMQNNAISGTDFTPPEATGTWLVAGSSSDVWIERILQAGTFNVSDEGPGRHRLDLTRTFVREHKGGVRGGSATVVERFRFWDAASGGNLLDESALNINYNSQEST